MFKLFNMTRERRSGLSRSERVEHLLSTFRHGTKKEREEEIPFDAPPIASSDEESESDASSGSHVRRGDIQSTNFGRQPSLGIPPRTVHSQPNNGRTTRSKRPATDDTGPSEPPPSKKRRSSASSADPLGEPSEHYVSSPVAGNLNRRFKVGYGRKAEARGEKQSTRNPASMNPDPRKVSCRARLTPIAGKYGSKRTLSRDKEDGSSEDNFVRPPELSPEKHSPEKRFSLRSIAMLESPSPQKAFKPVQVAPRRDPASSPQQPAPKSKPGSRKFQRRLSQRRSPREEPSEMSQGAVFKMPPCLSDSEPDGVAAGEVGNGLRDVQDILEVDAASSVSPRKPPADVTGLGPVCPVCSEPVDEGILVNFTKRSGAGFDEQMQFCAMHRKTAARKTWESRGYPKINWQKLDSRMARHHRYIKSVLEGESSFFRELLGQKVAAGEDRTVKKTDVRLVPGYYGMRGLRCMSDNIIHKFSALLRRQAVHDSAVSARGYTSFVQAVLVPELAVRLIMEDMSVKAEKARDILYESIAVGELLNEEIADVVVKDSDSDVSEDAGSD